VWVLVGSPLLLATAVVAARVGDTARFVTWPVVGFTAVASGVALAGIWAGSSEPRLLLAGIVPALVVAYLLPAAPLTVVTVVLVGMATVAITVRGVAAGVAATVGSVMVLFVIIQGPAVRCEASGVSTGSGPWWIDDHASSSGSGSVVPGGSAHGTTQVGSHRYRYTCSNGRLSRFERVQEAPAD
jgi:hypothetical protein